MGAYLPFCLPENEEKLKKSEDFILFLLYGCKVGERKFMQGNFLVAAGRSVDAAKLSLQFFAGETEQPKDARAHRRIPAKVLQPHTQTRCYEGSVADSLAMFF